MERVLSGMRPTGYLHLGNYVGALKQWVELQDKYECFYMVANLHAMTTDFDKNINLKELTLEMVIDWLSAGIDPNKSVIFVQSMVPEHSELFTLLSMITPLGWLERNPTYKDAKENIRDKDLNNIGFLAYPVLQAADIIIYKATRVPVGKDQLPHLEITREIIRRFNYLFGELFPEPQPILGEVTHVYGIDGRKMSKSYNNAIYIKDNQDEIYKKVKMMVTDTGRIKRTDPGNPDNCKTFPLYKVFYPEIVETVIEECIGAQIGCVECKDRIAKKIVEYLAPVKEKRKYYEKNIDEVIDILKEGSKKAREVASKTLQEVKEAMKLSI
ncbi:MAG: tryptophan--tRNA ligase [Brevinematales bacterium]|nr:tryptophan--tRNA ligase [Brevinematales bacterium]